MTETIKPSTTAEAVPKGAWAILAVTYLASITAPLAQFKVPPLAGSIIAAYGLNGVTFGYLMSALSIIGVILAFPAAFIIKKMGLKSVMLLSVGCCALGTAMAALTSTLEILYISRLIEGIGIGLVGVAGPTCVSVWFPPRKRGLALGLWATWVPIAIIVAFNVFPILADGITFRGVFWVLFALDVIAFVLFLLVYKMPKDYDEKNEEAQAASFGESLAILKNGKLWILGIIFLIFNVAQLGVINSFYNTFLESIGYSDVTASSLTSLQTVISFVIIPFVGVLYDKTPKSKKFLLLILVFVLYIVGMLPAFQTGDSQVVCMWVFLVVCGVSGALAGGICRPMAPNLVPNTAVGASMAMAVLQFCQNLGATFAPPIFGAMYESMGWQAASNTLLMPLFVIAILLSFAFVTRKKSNE